MVKEVNLVYLLIRSSPLIEHSSTVLLICLWLGAITTVFSSLIGLFQQDIKKVVAYSTMSQLARIYNKTIIIIYRIQAICVEFILLLLHSSPMQGLSEVGVNNSQVTKAHDYLNNNHISNERLTSHLSQYFYILSFIFSMSEQRKSITLRRWVGTSEAIRLILILVFFFVGYATRQIYNCWDSRRPSYGHSWFYFTLFISFLLNIILILCFSLPYLNLDFNGGCSMDQPLRGGGLFYTGASSKMKFIFLPLSSWARCNLHGCYFHRATEKKIRRRYSSTVTLQTKTPDLFFFEWLAGVIDGIGSFTLTKKGVARLTIIMDIRDKKALFDIRHKFGGSTHTVAKTNALKYQLSHKKGLIALLEAIKGLIRNPSRLLQMNKLCEKYNIEFLYPKPLTFNNGWLSGFIDGEGLVGLKEASGQVFISINQKNMYLLDPLVDIYGGRISIVNPKTEAFMYIIYRKKELFNLIDNYFSRYPLRTKKFNRIELIKEFYLKKISQNNQDVVHLMEWVKFKDKWVKYEDSIRGTKLSLEESGQLRSSAKLGGVLLPLNTGLVIPDFRAASSPESINKNSCGGVRFYSASSKNASLVYDDDFLEWFRGFVDGEASFVVRAQYTYAFKFLFQITLHVDDVNVLEFIRQSLGFGGVWVGEKIAVFKVGSLADIPKIIDIFRDRPLNTTKHLNFLDFKKAYELYTSNNNQGNKLELKQAIDNTILYMNSKRSNFSMPDNFKRRITPYWLLGFAEGEGSFYISKSNNFSLAFNICQSNRDLALMEEIKTYMLSLPGTVDKNNDSIHLSITKAPGDRIFDMVYLKVYHLDYITKVFIPFFDTMKWRSKKELDYLDWKTVLKLKELGLHYTDEGLNLIDKILSQMNVSRLSSNLKPKADRTSLLKDINRLLAGESNFEVRNGRIFIKSLNKYYSDPKAVKVQLQDKDGNTKQTFDSLSSCGRFLGVYPATIKTWIAKNKEVIVDKKPYFIVITNKTDSF